MKSLLRFILASATLTISSCLLAEVSVEQGKTVKLDIPVKTDFTCNIRVLHDGKDTDVVVDVKSGKGVYDFTADSTGVKEIRWEGKMKFRGLKTLAGCPGSGSITVKTVAASTVASVEEPKNSTSDTVVSEKAAVAVDAKEVALRFSKNPENAPVKTLFGSPEKIDFSSLRIPRIASNWGAAWNDRQELISTCFGNNQDSKLVLKGTEFSFRTNANQNIVDACNNWTYFTEGVLAGVNLSNKQWKEGQFFSNWTGNVGDFPVEFVSLNSNTFALGWYMSSGNGVFSEGTFGSPIGVMPTAGKGTYEGYVGYGTSMFASAVQFATVDFESNTISIRANFNGMGTLRSLTSPAPIAVNPKNGYFSGKVVSKGGNAAVPVTYSGFIVGYVGGEDGEIIHATYRANNSSSAGVDFVLGQRMKLEMASRPDQSNQEEQKKQKAIGTEPEKVVSESNPHQTAEKCLGNPEKLAKDLSTIIGFKYSGLKDCGMYIWSLNDGSVLLIQMNNKYGWKRSYTAGEYYCFDNYTKRKYRGKWDTCDL